VLCGLEAGAVDLVDDHHIGHAQIGLSRVIGQLLSGAEGIDDDDAQSRRVEREVVVAAVPDNHVRLNLRLGEDRAVVDAGVHDHPHLDGSLVLLTLLDGRVRRIDLVHRREALHAHGDEIPVRHRVPDECDTEPGVHQNPADTAAGLTLA
jgi:hypothetical protein